MKKLVTMRVTQVQDFARGIPVFRVPVAVAIVTPAGKRVHNVWIRAKEETFEFAAESRPRLVRFDEGNVLLKEASFPKEADELVYQLRNDDVIGRISAAAELLRSRGDPRVFEGLTAAAQGDPFWAVRRSAIDSLGKLGDPRAAAVLQKTCLDAHSSVRAASLAALGDSKDRGLIEWYKERFGKDESDQVRAEALRALGKTGDSSVIPFLTQSASVPSHRDMLRSAATQALKQLGRRPL